LQYFYTTPNFSRIWRHFRTYRNKVNY